MGHTSSTGPADGRAGRNPSGRHDPPGGDCATDPLQEDPLQHRRRALMALLAQAQLCELEAALATLAPLPDVHMLPAPEVGLVMVRGRMGGSGAPFNLGEATLTRAAVRLEGGATGVSYRLGRDLEAARACALLDALWLDARRRDAVEIALAPVEARLASEAQADARKTATTKVNFFTLVRGED